MPRHAARSARTVGVGVRARRHGAWVTAAWFASSATVGFGSAARAAEPPARATPPPPKYTPFVNRGNSLPAPYAYGTLGFSGTAKAGERTSVEGSIGGGVGLTQRLWLDASSGSFKVAPALGYHSPQVGLSALLLETPVIELDATTHVTFASESGRPVEQIEPGIMTVVHVAGKLRIDGGLFVGVNPGDTTTVGMRVPAAVGFQITEHVHAAFSSGVTVDSLADTRGTTAIPLGLTLGWSDRLSAGGPSVSVSPSVSFPEMIKPGAAGVLNPNNVTIGVTLGFVSKL